MPFNTQQESTLWLCKGPTYEYDGNTIQTRAPFSTENTKKRSHCRDGEARQSEPLNCSSVSIFTAKKALQNYYSIVTKCFSHSAQVIHEMQKRCQIMFKTQVLLKVSMSSKDVSIGSYPAQVIHEMQKRCQIMVGSQMLHMLHRVAESCAKPFSSQVKG